MCSLTNLCLFLLVYFGIISCIPNGLTSDEKLILLKAHNDYRKQIANGEINGYKHGSNINELVWDESLALIAKDYSKECIWRHNPHPWNDILKYQNISHFIWDKRVGGSTNHFGENMYLGRTKVTMNELLDGLHAFFNEYKWWNYDTQTCKKGKRCGHFLQMISAQTRYVGCGYTFCDRTWKTHERKNEFVKGRVLLVCNYWPSGWLASYPEPYLIGEPCSQCDKDRNECNDGLCSGCMSPYYHFCDKNLIGGCNNLCPRLDRNGNNKCNINSKHIDCLDCRHDCNVCSDDIKLTCVPINDENVLIPGVIPDDSDKSMDDTSVDTLNEDEFAFSENMDSNVYCIKNCKVWFDGCNSNTCENGIMKPVTQHNCNNKLFQYCKICNDGYEYRNGECQPIKCESNKIWDKCGHNYCQSSCYNRSPHCMISKCKPGCQCPINTLWNEKDKLCVLPNKCPIESQCLKDQKYYECGPSCPQTCDSDIKPCNTECISGCFCVPPLILHNNECISKDECPPKPKEPSCNNCKILNNNCNQYECNPDSTLGLHISQHQCTNINLMKYCHKCRDGYLFQNKDGTCSSECNDTKCGPCIPRTSCWTTYKPELSTAVVPVNQCPNGMVYNEIGVHPLCLPTCLRMNPICKRNIKNYPGCYCPENTYLYGSKCLTKRKCIGVQSLLNQIRLPTPKPVTIITKDKTNKPTINKNIDRDVGKERNCICNINPKYIINPNNINCDRFINENICIRFRQCKWDCNIIE